jgi:hypothetical protein
MKTKELIRLLQVADPFGEGECCVDNEDIDVVYTSEAYWDGCLQVFKRDSNHRIVGAKFVGSGNKVVIQPLSIEYAILNDTDLPVEFIDLSTLRQADLEKLVQKWRDEANQVLNDVEKESFIKYILKRYLKMIFGEITEEQENKA